MKKIITILFLLSTVVGCAFIYNKDETIKSVGVEKPEAKEILDQIRNKPDSEKIKVWPRDNKN
ncbi:MAG: hypothetical protein PHY73_01445 [Candidatus Omnitrophica bacterium]|nr:hypothetical protein [Candidatus Omnitrophota bacterium]